MASFCPFCGAQTDAQWQFCPSCGKPAPSTTAGEGSALQRSADGASGVPRKSKVGPRYRWAIYRVLGAAAVSLFFYNLGRQPEARRENEEFVKNMATARIAGIPADRQGLQQEFSPADIFKAAAPPSF